MDLQHTAALVANAGRESDPEKLRTMLGASYDELERAWFTPDHKDFSLQEVMVATFQGLDLENPAIKLYHDAALEIARRVDNGDDHSAGNIYHNAMHFAKVAVSFRALAEIQNNMESAPRLNAKEIASGLFAAASHDICHNGKTNTVDGQHVPFRLEGRSIEQAKAWTAQGRSWGEKSALEQALFAVLGTDVSTNPMLSGIPSPGRIVRQWHDHYFADPTVVPFYAPGISEKLNPLKDNRQRILVAAILQDADVLASVVNDRQHVKESLRVTQEQDPAATAIDPKRELGFLQGILDERMTTAAGGRLANDFIRRKIREYSKPSP